MRQVPLDLLAGWLRDGELVDMRVLHGEDMVTLERVEITEIIVRREDEALTAKQEFVDGDATLQHDLVIECENLYWARPTSFELHTVNPVQDYHPEPDTLEDVSGVMDKAWEAVADNHDIVQPVAWFREKVLDGTWMSSGANISVRHLVILTAWHTSDLQPDRICKLVGYHSPQPFMTACDKVHLNGYEEGLRRKGDLSDRRATQHKNWCKALDECVTSVLAHGGKLRSEERRTGQWALG